MLENINETNELLARLNSLSRKQDNLAREINDLREEIRIRFTTPQPEEVREKVIAEKPVEKPIAIKPPVFTSKPLTTIRERVTEKKTPKINLEELIGENLISKIGIVILVLGVGIGAKYAIDHQLISPLARIIMGYMVGLGLLGFAIKLRKNYDNFSAVLLSGAMAILYFITFAAYNFFSLIPQWVAFVLMVAFTIFTVMASLSYNKQIIAHIGLVGAYAVPFLLSDGSGKALVLFAYMAIINTGILAIAFRKYWKILNYVAFALTWIIYSSWYQSSFQAATDFNVAAVFLAVFFVTFYITILAYKLHRKEKFNLADVILILGNSFVFYGWGYSLLNHYDNGSQLLGVFTLGNAILHSIVSAVIYKQKLGDRNLFFLVSGLVLVFITIAIPVQLDGNWVTLLWIGQAALLFWIGRTKNAGPYEILSYVLMVLAFFSLLQDWASSNNYLQEGTVSITQPFLNVGFLTSMFFVASFGFVLWLNQNKRYPSVFIQQPDLLKLVSVLIPLATIFVLYLALLFEISAVFDIHYLNTGVKISMHTYSIYNQDIIDFKTGWQINYSLLFIAVLTWANLQKIKNNLLSDISMVLSILSVFIFLTLGLYSLSNLRESYLKPLHPEYFTATDFHLLFRYLSFIFVGLIFMANKAVIKSKPVNKDIKTTFLLASHITILWILTSELINWMSIAGYSASYKLGITILWGIYALVMVVLGIWKQNQMLRIAAIVLFGGTLLKLFLYDIASLSTISKTIVLVSLGVLLLIISFLYNKYKHFIFGGRED